MAFVCATGVFWEKSQTHWGAASARRRFLGDGASGVGFFFGDERLVGRGFRQL